MARFKSVVAARVVTAGKKRKCHHSKEHVSEKGEPCLEVPSGMGWKGYCAACGIEMVERGLATLTELRNELT